MSNVIRKTVGVIALSVFSFFIGCEKVEIGVEPLEFQLNVGLYEDMNGYYHLPLNLNNLQTLHRVSGRILRNGDPVDVVDFGWYCDMHWLSTDTMGYVVENIGSSELWYIGYDTTYLTWFSGFEVPIVNGSSYSNADGEVNTMIAPVRTMRGDTATFYYSYWDNWRYEATTGLFKIIFN